MINPFVIRELEAELASLRKADPYAPGLVARSIEDLIDRKIREYDEQRRQGEARAQP